jgi:membrane-associated phospholipid phosphatase
MAHAVTPEPSAAQFLEPSEPGFWAASGVLLFMAWRLDDNLRRSEPDERNGVPARLAHVGYRLGTADAIVPGFLSAMAVTHVTGWPTDSDRILRAAAGAVAAGLAVAVVKTTVGRGRPRDVGDPGAFQAFSRDNAWLSFPSGHAAAAFAVAGALDQEFDLRGFQYLGYGLATMVAWSRTYHDAHWVSDTVAGGIIGMAASRGAVALLQDLAGASPPDLRLGVLDGAPLISLSLPVP